MRLASLKLTVIAIASAAMLSGCASVSRGMGKMTSNKYAEARSGTVWVVPPPQLEPPRASEKNVYISYRNISDAQDIQLLDLMKNAAREQGWEVVNTPDAAHYRLRAQLRYFGEVEPESGGATVARNLGNIMGAAAGVGTGVAIGRATDSGVAGAVGGVAAGGLVAAGLQNASKPREWAMILDFVLEERQDKPVTFEMHRESSSSATSSAGAGNARMAAGGGTASGNTSGGTAIRKSNYFPHGVRLSAWANQMAMKEEEALPEIIDRTEKVVTQILPM
jgi:hypothetical protein